MKKQMHLIIERGIDSGFMTLKMLILEQIDEKGGSNG
jgi:flagellar assembly factor FliW